MRFIPVLILAVLFLAIACGDGGPTPHGDASRCHPSYEGACLDRNARDYDCSSVLMPNLKEPLTLEELRAQAARGTLSQEGLKANAIARQALVDARETGLLYTGRVRIVGPDVFDLDPDGDGVGCD